MKVALDANALITWASSKDEMDIGKLNALFNKASAVFVPTPALAEFLVGAQGQEYAWLAGMERKSRFKLLPFDRRAAAECAQLERYARAQGIGKQGGSSAPWQKVKVDRQILAIALVNQADLLISMDSDLVAMAAYCELETASVGDLETPEELRQRSLELVMQPEEQMKELPQESTQSPNSK